MTREEAIRKLEYSKKAYQRLIDEKVDSGKLVGKDVKGEWKANTPLDEVYKSMIDALEMAIKALEGIEKIRAEVESINAWSLRYAPTYDEDIRPQIVSNVKEHVLQIIDKYRAESEE